MGLVSWVPPDRDDDGCCSIPEGAVSATFGIRREYVARATDSKLGILVGRASVCDNGDVLLVAACSRRYVFRPLSCVTSQNGRLLRLGQHLKEEILEYAFCFFTSYCAYSAGQSGETHGALASRAHCGSLVYVSLVFSYFNLVYADTSAHGFRRIRQCSS